MKKEDNNKPLLENLENLNYNDLELIYRKPCLHSKLEDRNECGNCKYGQNSECIIHKAYLRIKEKLEILELLKNSKMDIELFYKMFIVKRYTYDDYKNYLINHLGVILNIDQFESLRKWLNERH